MMKGEGKKRALESKRCASFKLVGIDACCRGGCGGARTLSKEDELGRIGLNGSIELVKAFETNSRPNGEFALS